MGTDVFETAQSVSEPLHEYRTPAQRGAKPVAVTANIGGEAEECPEAAEVRLFALKRIGVGQRARPKWTVILTHAIIGSIKSR